MAVFVWLANLMKPRHIWLPKNHAPLYAYRFVNAKDRSSDNLRQRIAGTVFDLIVSQGRIADRTPGAMLGAEQAARALENLWGGVSAKQRQPPMTTG